MAQVKKFSFSISKSLIEKMKKTLIELIGKKNLRESRVARVARLLFAESSLQSSFKAYNQGLRDVVLRENLPKLNIVRDNPKDVEKTRKKWEDFIKKMDFFKSPGYQLNRMLRDNYDAREEALGIFMAEYAFPLLDRIFEYNLGELGKGPKDFYNLWQKSAENKIKTIIIKESKRLKKFPELQKFHTVVNDDDDMDLSFLFNKLQTRDIEKFWDKHVDDLRKEWLRNYPNKEVGELIFDRTWEMFYEGHDSPDNQTKWNKKLHDVMKNPSNQKVKKETEKLQLFLKSAQNAEGKLRKQLEDKMFRPFKMSSVNEFMNPVEAIEELYANKNKKKKGTGGMPWAMEKFVQHAVNNSLTNPNSDGGYNMNVTRNDVAIPNNMDNPIMADDGIAEQLLSVAKLLLDD